MGGGQLQGLLLFSTRIFGVCSTSKALFWALGLQREGASQGPVLVKLHYEGKMTLEIDGPSHHGDGAHIQGRLSLIAFRDVMENLDRMWQTKFHG